MTATERKALEAKVAKRMEQAKKDPAIKAMLASAERRTEAAFSAYAANPSPENKSKLDRETRSAALLLANVAAGKKPEFDAGPTKQEIEMAKKAKAEKAKTKKETSAKTPAKKKKKSRSRTAKPKSFL